MQKQFIKVAVFLIMILSACLVSTNLHAQHHGASGGGEAAAELEEVVVTAARLQGYLEEHPQQVEMMGRAEIQERGYTDLDQVLNALPGVEVKPSGSGLGSRLSIRGSGGGSKILVLINGRPMGSSQYGVVNLDSIPLDMVARVDVFKPPVPVWLGAGATAGAINIVLTDGAGAAGAGEKTSRVGVTAGSFGKVGATASRLMALGEHDLRLSAAGNHKDGRRENSDSDTGSFSFQWDLPSRGGLSFDAGGRYYQSEHGSPGPLYNLTPDARQSYRHGDMDLRIQGPVGGEAGGFDLKTYLTMTRLEDESQSGLVSTLDALTYGMKDETNWATDDGRWAFRASGSLSGDRIDHTQSGAHHREHAALGLQGDRTFSAVIATLGGRMDYSTDYGFQPAADGGISISKGKTRLKVNAGYSVNIPTFSQLYQPSHGSIDQVRGNPDLDAERVWTASAGVSHEFSDKRTVEVTLFYEGIRDKIAYQERDDNIKQPENIDDAWRRGVESTVGWEMTDSISMDLSWICQESRNRETGGELTYAPSRKFKMSVAWTLPTGTRTETDLNCVGSHYSDLENTPEKKVDGYATVDLKIVHPVTLRQCRMDLSLQFENLLDEPYDVHYGYPDDGFRFAAGMILDF